MSPINIRSLILLALISDTLQSDSTGREGQVTSNLRRRAQNLGKAKRNGKGNNGNKGKKGNKGNKGKKKGTKEPTTKRSPSVGKKKKTKKSDKKAKGKDKSKGKGTSKHPKIPKECDFAIIPIDAESYQDGKCDKLLNTDKCHYDGGDCDEFNEDYPNCSILNPSWVGDNFCDGNEYNTTECGYDGGDCIQTIDFGCSGAGNGYCENIFNNEKCDYDGGDCLVFNNLYPHCKVLIPSYVGDGKCDIEPYYTEECGWDGGDCDQFPVNCNVTNTFAIGDGVCNIEFNTTDCEYDGGDCLSDCEGIDCNNPHPYY